MDKRNLDGFTVIELIIVIACVSILAAIAYPKAQLAVRRSMEATTLGNLALLRATIMLYKTDTEDARLHDLYDLAPKYIKALPVTMTWWHPTDNSGGVGTDAEMAVSRDDWWLISDTSDPRDQQVFVNCEHTDLKGNVWYKY